MHAKICVVYLVKYEEYDVNWIVGLLSKTTQQFEKIIEANHYAASRNWGGCHTRNEKYYPFLGLKKSHTIYLLHLILTDFYLL